MASGEVRSSGSMSSEAMVVSDHRSSPLPPPLVTTPSSSSPSSSLSSSPSSSPSSSSSPLSAQMNDEPLEEGTLLHDAVSGLADDTSAVLGMARLSVGGDGDGRRARKWLPEKWQYDAKGSSIFDAIMHSQQYPLYRHELAVLRAHAAHIARAADCDSVVELGPGDGSKSVLMLEALVEECARRSLPSPAYLPVELAHDASDWLDTLRLRVAASCPKVAFLPVSADFTKPYQLPLRPGVVSPAVSGGRSTSTSGDAKEWSWSRPLCMFLGSSIGNCEDVVGVLRNQRRVLGDGAMLLIGSDLDKSDRGAAGVTVMEDYYRGPLETELRRNLLNRLNRECDADFDPSLFVADARWVGAPEHRIEMLLVAERAHSVKLGGGRWLATFTAGESIFVGPAAKLSSARLTAAAVEAGWYPVKTTVATHATDNGQWHVPGMPHDTYALTLFAASPPTSS